MPVRHRTIVAWLTVSALLLAPTSITSASIQQPARMTTESITLLAVDPQAGTATIKLSDLHFMVGLLNGQARIIAQLDRQLQRCHR